MTTTKSPHIVIADDEPRLQSSLKFLFNGKGYVVTSATTGTDALEKLNSFYAQKIPVDLLITDIQMPMMDGEHLIQVIREVDATMPILVMTGVGSKELVVNLMKLGCTSYIEKPFSLEALEDQVGVLLEKARKISAEKQHIEHLNALETQARTLGHDMNNMLNIAINYAEFALGDIDAFHPAHSRLVKVLASTNAAAHLAKELFNLNDKPTTTAVERTDVHACVAYTADQLQSFSPDDIVVRVVCSGDLVLTKVDAKKLRSVLLNLGNNAIDAMKGSGTLTLSTTVVVNTKESHEPVWRCARITVSDTGSGFTQEQLAQVFKKGFSTKRQGHGHGLLAVQNMVEEFNGWVEVKNGEQGGAEINIYIPMDTKG
jgi:DNA-binding response OmpR family regulator